MTALTVTEYLRARHPVSYVEMPFLILQQFRVGNIVIPILQVRKVGLREFK